MSNLAFVDKSCCPLDKSMKMLTNFLRKTCERRRRSRFSGVSLVFGGVSGHLVLVAHDCGYPLSRYMCRATRVAADFLDFLHGGNSALVIGF